MLLSLLCTSCLTNPTLVVVVDVALLPEEPALSEVEWGICCYHHPLRYANPRQKMARLLKLLPLLLIIPAAGILYQWLGTRRDKRRFLDPNKLIDLGEGRQIYLCQMGEGTPAVIFESGIGATGQNWTLLQQQISRQACTVSYDRLGLGWSSPATTHRTPSYLARELQALLDQAGIAPPYLLVGHSFGGLVARRFAADHPGKVAGVLLIDPMRPEQWPPFSDAQRNEIDRGLRFSRIGPPLVRIGLVRLVMTSLLCGSGRVARAISRITGSDVRFLFDRINHEVAKMPPECRPIIVATWSSPNFYRGLAAYLNAIPASTVEMYEAPPIDGVPILILTAANATPLDDEALARIGSNAHQLHPEDTTHWIHLDQPHHVLNAIQSLLEEIRSTQQTTAAQSG